MKKSIFIMVAVVLFCAGFTSCGKKGDSNESASTGFLLKGTVDGKELVCPTGTANFSSELQALHAVGRIKAGATFTGLDLFLIPFAGKGTYILGAKSSNIGQYYLTADGNEENAYSTGGTAVGTGKVIVDSYENEIATGTFEFTAGNTTGGSKKITNGSFSFKVAKQ